MRSTAYPPPTSQLVSPHPQSSRMQPHALPKISALAKMGLLPILPSIIPSSTTVLSVGSISTGILPTAPAGLGILGGLIMCA